MSPLVDAFAIPHLLTGASYFVQNTVEKYPGTWFMSLPPPERKALEELWLARLRDAKLAVDFARNYFKEVQKDLSSLPPSDGQFALGRAVRAENVALEQYNRVLGIYTNLTKGIMPTEDDWPPRASAADD